MAAVEEKDDILYFPKTIPALRKDTTSVHVLSLIITQVVAACLMNASWSLAFLSSFGTLAFGVLILIVAQFLSRVLSLKEESEHLISRYENDFRNLIIDVFTFSSATVVAFLFSLVLVVFGFFLDWYKAILNEESHVSLIAMFIATLIGSSFIAKMIKLEECPLRTSVMINSLRKCGLDFGSSMAYAFFYGYLNIVLPAKGTEDKGIVENMEDYEDSENITFGIKKLFVLIPLSCKCNVSLDEFEGIENSKTLESIVLTRAGVKNRVYKNSVYKIVDAKGKKVYAAAEYATPIKTMQDIMSQNSPHADFYQKFKKEITVQFYLTLRNVLKSDNMNNLCELIFYDDANGTVNIKDVLLKRIKKLKQMQKKSD